MHQNTFVVAQLAQHVRLDFVFLDFVKTAVLFSTAEPPGAFDHLALPKKVGALHRVRFVRRPENDSIAKVQREHLRLVGAERRDQGGRGLSGGDDGCARPRESRPRSCNRSCRPRWPS